jgi:TolB-like protein/predicted Zn-dependent protease
MADRVEPDNAQKTAKTAQAASVFISYASQDKVVADAVCHALEQAGIACWIAPRDVVPGKSYAGAIVHAIDATKVVVLVLSENGAASQHVLREVERASSKRHPVVAFRIDLAPMPADLEYFLNTSQWLDASAIGVESALPKLVDAVQRAIAPVSGAPPGDAGSARKPVANLSQQPPVAKQVSHPPSRWVLALGVLVTLALAYVLVDKLWLAKHATVVPPTKAANNIVSNKSIAVLPFTDLSEKKDQEYFGDGMAEEILDLLAKIPGIAVIGRTSSFQFKDKNVDLRTIGAQLNAAHILEGSIRKSGEQVRITAQLINTMTGTHEWSETYDRQVGDVLKLQDAIAAAVVREMQLTVAPDALGSRPAFKSPEAYDLYLRGRHAVDRFDKEGLEEAVTLFQQALDREPTSADAAAALSWAYDVQGEWSFLPPAAAVEEARRAAANALSLDPKNVLAHRVLGRIHMNYDWDWAAAERDFNQIAKLAPSSVDALIGQAWLSLALGRWDDALREINAALVLDPLDPESFEVLAHIRLRRGNLPEAEAAMRRGLDIRPTYAWAHYILGLILLARGEREAALREMQQETPDDGGQQAGLAIVYYALGRQAESDAALARMLKEHADMSAYIIAEAYAFRGQSGEAIHWLERAYAQKDANMLLLKCEMPQRSLAADPHFKAFLRKMKLPE